MGILYSPHDKGICLEAPPITPNNEFFVLGQAPNVPEDWTLVAYLCVGWPEAESLQPDLERKGWEKRGLSQPLDAPK